LNLFPVPRIPSVFGLNEWAEKLVEKAVERKKLSEEKDVFFVEPNGRPRYEYTLPNGEVVYEDVQPSPEGVNDIFLALKDRAGENWLPESLWSRGEIFAMLNLEDPRIPQAIETGELVEIQ
jgi:hypothetical protein